MDERSRAKAPQVPGPTTFWAHKPRLGAELQRLDLIDEYRLVIHPIIAGHGPRLFDGLDAPRQLERVSVTTFRGGQTAMHLRRMNG